MGLSTTPPCPPGQAQRESGTISLPVRGFHHTSSSPWMGKGLMGHILPGTWHLGVTCSTGCSPKEEKESWGWGRSSEFMERTV